MKIATRLVFLAGIMSVLLVAVGLVGLRGMASSNDALRTVYEDRTVPLGQLAEIQYRMLNNVRIFGAVSDSLRPEQLRALAQEVDGNHQAIAQVWKAYMATYLTPEESDLAQIFAAANERFTAEAIQTGLAALRSGNALEAQRLNQEIVPRLFAPTQQVMQKLLTLQLDVAKAEYASSVKRFDTVRTVAIAAIVIGLLVASALSAWLIRGITRAVAHAVAVSQAIADGDLTVPVIVQGRDEMTVLMTALRAMKEGLTQVVSRVRSSSEGVATASSEIAHGNHDLSIRTEQQASALQQTAASMEELSATVNQNADAARQASQLATGASTVAQQGGQVVDEVVQTMKEIHQASSKIHEIISVIEGIAFQTNILALNAAVEAARAGEQGRGFAVVATEVRSLAGRSAQAAKEIKTLIGNSVACVEKGSLLADRAGGTMAEVVIGIQRVADIIGEISAASTEQATGVSQVGDAVLSMDQVTQQNAALVEEMAAAASSLKSQAQDLVQVVATFRL